jgi:hypothetical protein
MKPDKTSAYDSFYNQRRFPFPLYQRPSVWSVSEFRAKEERTDCGRHTAAGAAAASHDSTI